MRHYVSGILDDLIHPTNTAADGAPHAPRRLIKRIAGPMPKRSFFLSGQAFAAQLAALLEQNGYHPGSFRTILDFGCGVGRVTRHLGKWGADRVIGVDRDPEAIAWCKDNLPAFGSYFCNSTRTRLDIESGSVDLLCAVSVFTHLSEPDFDYWLTEVARMLSPGQGIAYLTLNGARRVADGAPTALTVEEKRSFREGQRVVVNASVSGDSRLGGREQCYCFVPSAAALEMFSTSFEVIKFTEGRSPFQQDSYLLRRL
jgi:SAM-dependent methyltransferase